MGKGSGGTRASSSSAPKGLISAGPQMSGAMSVAAYEANYQPMREKFLATPGWKREDVITITKKTDEHFSIDGYITLENIKNGDGTLEPAYRAYLEAEPFGGTQAVNREMAKSFSTLEEAKSHIKKMTKELVKRKEAFIKWQNSQEV